MPRMPTHHLQPCPLRTQWALSPTFIMAIFITIAKIIRPTTNWPREMRWEDDGLRSQGCLLGGRGPLMCLITRMLNVSEKSTMPTYEFYCVCLANWSIPHTI